MFFRGDTGKYQNPKEVIRPLLDYIKKVAHNHEQLAIRNKSDYKQR